MMKKIKTIFFALVAVLACSVFAIPTKNINSTFADVPDIYYENKGQEQTQINTFLVSSALSGSNVTNLSLNASGQSAIKDSFIYFYTNGIGKRANESTATELIHDAADGSVRSTTPGNGQFVSTIDLDKNMVVALREGYISSITAAAYTHSRTDNSWESKDSADKIIMDVYAYSSTAGVTDYAHATYGASVTQTDNYGSQYSATIDGAVLKGNSYDKIMLSFRSELVKATTSLGLFDVESTTGHNNMVVKEPMVYVNTNDTQKPVIQISEKNVSWATGDELTFAVQDAHSGIQTIEYSADGETWELISDFSENYEYKQSHTFAKQIAENGSYYVKVTDNVGNQSVSVHNESKIDTTSSELSINASNEVYTSKTVSFNLSATNVISPETYNYKITLNSIINKTKTEDVVLTGAFDGTTLVITLPEHGNYSIEVFGVDAVSNQSSISATEFNVDARIVASLLIDDEYTYNPAGLTLIYQKSIDADFILKFTYTNVDETKSYASISDVGEYKVSYDIPDPEYKGSGYQIITINPMQVTLSNVKTQYEYNTQVQELEFVSSIENLVFNIKYTQTSNDTAFKNAGDYVYEITSASANYVVLNGIGTASISKHEVELSNFVSTFVYDKTTKEVLFDIDELIENNDINVKYYTLNDSQYNEISNPVNAGTYYAVFEFVGDVENFEFNTHSTFATALEMNIAKKDISVSAVSHTLTYGDDIPALTYNAVGLLEAEPIEFTLSCVGLTQNVGYYNITINQKYELSQAEQEVFRNYNVTYTEGYINILQKQITIVPVQGQSKVYGEQDQTILFEDVSAMLVYGDVLTGTLSREVGEIVGYYNITIGSLANSNYELNLAHEIYEITKRAAFVVIDSANKIYGDADPSFSFNTQSSNVLASDIEEFLKLSVLNREIGENVGEYKISLNTEIFETNPVLKNYSILQAEEYLVIKKATLLVSVENIQTEYDNEVEIVPVVSGFKLDDNFEINLVRETGKNVGTYKIVLGENNFENYEIDFAGATYTIVPRQISIVAQNATKVYGETDELSCEIVGAKEVLYAQVFRISGESVGEYAIIGYAFKNPNYVVTNFVSATLKITKAPIHVTIFDSNKLYGEIDGTFAYEVSGLLNCDNLNISLEREIGENVGVYDVLISENEFDNYYVESVSNGTFEIKKANVDLVLEDKTVVYSGEVVLPNNPNADFEITYKFFQNGEMVESIVDAGEYEVVAMFAGDNNHNEAISNTAKIVVEKKFIPITLKTLTFLYTGKQQAPEYQINLETNVSVIIKYKGDLVPVEVGEYEFSVHSNNSNYYATTTGTLKIVADFSSENNNGSSVSTSQVGFSEDVQLVLANDSKLMSKFNALFDGVKCEAVYKFANAEKVTSKGELFTVKLKALEGDANVEIYTIDENGKTIKTLYSTVDGYYVFTVNSLSGQFMVTKTNNWLYYAKIMLGISAAFALLIVASVTKKKKRKNFIKTHTKVTSFDKKELEENLDIVSSKFKKEKRVSMKEFMNDKS